MKPLIMDDLKHFTFGNENIEKHRLKWGFSIPEKRAFSMMIQAQKNSLLKSFHDRSMWSKQRLEEWKVAQIRNLVDWAFETTDFYREKYSKAGYEPGAICSLEDFAELPSLTREEIVGAFPDLIVSREIDIKTCRWFFSSGSSGTPVQLVGNQERTVLDTLHRHRTFERMTVKGHFAKDRWLYNINHAHWWHVSFNGDHPVFSVSQRCPLEDILLHMEKLRPVFVSSITGVVQKMAEWGVDLSKYGVEGVSTNSETSTAEQRRQWSQILGVPVCDEYSSEEAGLLASECCAGGYHLIEDDTHVELADQDTDGYGRVLATDLWNFAMPTIKYEQGDYARLSGRETCACGSCFKQIDGVQGRIDEAFVKKDGGRVMPSQMLVIAEELLSTSGMDTYQVVQKRVDKVEVKYRGESSGILLKNQWKLFSIEMNVIFGYPVDVNFIEIPLGQPIPHKRKLFVCEIENKEQRS